LKSKIIIGLLLLYPELGYSQGEWNNWCFGVNAQMVFTSGTPQGITGSALYQSAGGTSATVSDSLGNLLFACNGYKVWNRNQVVMPNGNGIVGGNVCQQPVFAVPKPGDPGKYYLFTVGEPGQVGSVTGLHYSVIDMSLQGGLGDVVAGMKNIPVPDGDFAIDQLTGTRHFNNQDVWIVVLKHGTNSHVYHSYLVTATGITTPPVASPSNLPACLDLIGGHYYYKRGGDMKISWDGEHLVCSDSLTEICQFNSSTGIITPRFLIYPPGYGNGCRGAEFSVDSRFLYLCLAGGYGPQWENQGWQFDMSSPDSLSFVQSQVLLGGGFGSKLHLGPDWKIYAGANPFIDSLHCITYPDLPGTACGYQNNAVSLLGNDNNQCLVQFLQRYKAYIQESGLCFQDSTHLWGDIWPPADSIHWDLGDPASGLSNTSNLPDPGHVYPLPGNYTIRLYVRHIDNRIDSSTKVIEIHPKPFPDLGADQTICTGNSVTVDAGFFSGCTYQWSNLTAGLPNIGTSQTFTTSEAAIYMVTITSSFGCVGRDTVQLFTSPVPVVTNSPLSDSACSGVTTNIPLFSNSPYAMFFWTVTLTSGSVTGFSVDSGLIIQQTLINMETTPGVVTYHITPRAGSCIGNAVDFPVTVYTGDSVDVVISPSGNDVCAGTAVTFTATPINGGNSPDYQWQINHADTGTNNNLFTYIPSNNDTVTCILTYSEACSSNNPAASNEIILTVNPISPVSLSISTADNPVCQGNTSTYTSSAMNKGILPVFQWFVNGIHVGTNDSVFSYTPLSGDQIYCVLTSSEQCTSNNPANSNFITMTVSPLLPVGVTISPSNNPICGGLPVTFVATPTNSGTMPEYQWKVNAGNAGINNAVFTYTPENGDIVSCVLTSSEPCTSGNPASSNPVITTVVEAPEITFTPCFDTITTTNAKPIKLKGGIPLGGTYSGSGTGWTSETGWTFDPALAGAGIHEIIYNYINSAGCRDSAKTSVLNSQLSILNCGDSLTDIRDNKKYPTIQLGSQCWFAANLDYGTEIAYTIPQRDNCIPEKYSRPTSYVPRPTFYQWDELMCYQETEALQGLCPPGWHIPSESDWNALFATWTNSAFAGEPLKYTGYSGFNAFLNGAGFFNKGWWFGDSATFFWSSTSHGSYKAWAHGMHEVNYSVSYYPSYRANSFAVRCVRD